MALLYRFSGFYLWNLPRANIRTNTVFRREMPEDDILRHYSDRELRNLATESFQKVVGDTIGIAEVYNAMVGRFVQVICAFAAKLDIYIKFRIIATLSSAASEISVNSDAFNVHVIGNKIVILHSNAKQRANDESLSGGYLFTLLSRASYNVFLSRKYIGLITYPLSLITYR